MFLIPVLPYYSISAFLQDTNFHISGVKDTSFLSLHINSKPITNRPELLP